MRYNTIGFQNWIFNGIWGDDWLAQAPLADRNVRAQKNPPSFFYEVLYLVHLRGIDHHERCVCRHCERGWG